MSTQLLTLPGLALPPSMADILRRVQAPLPPLAAVVRPAPAQPALKLPPVRPGQRLSRIEVEALPPRERPRPAAGHRHELPHLDGFELRLHGVAVVRVSRTVIGWRLVNLGSGGIRDGLDRTEAEAMAARIARLMAAE